MPLNKALLGERLRAEVRHSGLTVLEVASRVPVSPQALHAYFRGTRTPALATVVRIAEVLGVRASRLLEGQPESVRQEAAQPQIDRALHQVRLERGDSGEGVTDLPVLGHIRAGALSEIEQRDQGVLRLPEAFAEHADYALRIEGDSMEPTLREGEYVAVRRQHAAEDGDTVVARVGAELVLKRLRLSPHGTTLQSDNPGYAAIPVAAGEHAVEGVVTCSWRPRNVLRR
jgi:SOS-response transcriptional repressor LexA